MSTSPQPPRPPVPPQAPPPPVAPQPDERRFHSVRFEEFLDIVPTSGTLGTVRERPRQFAD